MPGTGSGSATQHSNIGTKLQSVFSAILVSFSLFTATYRLITAAPVFNKRLFKTLDSDIGIALSALTDLSEDELSQDDPQQVLKDLLQVFQGFMRLGQNITFRDVWALVPTYNAATVESAEDRNLFSKGVAHVINTGSSLLRQAWSMGSGQAHIQVMETEVSIWSHKQIAKIGQLLSQNGVSEPLDNLMGDNGTLRHWLAPILYQEQVDHAPKRSEREQEIEIGHRIRSLKDTFGRWSEARPATAEALADGFIAALYENKVSKRFREKLIQVLEPVISADDYALGTVSDAHWRAIAGLFLSEHDRRVHTQNVDKVLNNIFEVVSGHPRPNLVRFERLIKWMGDNFSVLSKYLLLPLFKREQNFKATHAFLEAVASVFHHCSEAARSRRGADQFFSEALRNLLESAAPFRGRIDALGDLLGQGAEVGLATTAFAATAVEALMPGKASKPSGWHTARRHFAGAALARRFTGAGGGSPMTPTAAPTGAAPEPESVPAVQVLMATLFDDDGVLAKLPEDADLAKHLKGAVVGAHLMHALQRYNRTTTLDDCATQQNESFKAMAKAEGIDEKASTVAVGSALEGVLKQDWAVLSAEQNTFIDQVMMPWLSYVLTLVEQRSAALDKPEQSAVSAVQIEKMLLPAAQWFDYLSRSPGLWRHSLISQALTSGLDFNALIDAVQKMAATTGVTVAPEILAMLKSDDAHPSIVPIQPHEPSPESRAREFGDWRRPLSEMNDYLLKRANESRRWYKYTYKWRNRLRKMHSIYDKLESLHNTTTSKDARCERRLRLMNDLGWARLQFGGIWIDKRFMSSDAAGPSEQFWNFITLVVTTLYSVFNLMRNLIAFRTHRFADKLAALQEKVEEHSPPDAAAEQTALGQELALLNQCFKQMREDCEASSDISATYYASVTEADSVVYHAYHLPTKEVWQDILNGKDKKRAHRESPWFGPLRGFRAEL